MTRLLEPYNTRKKIGQGTEISQSEGGIRDKKQDNINNRHIHNQWVYKE